MKKTVKTFIATLAASTALFAGTATFSAHGTEQHEGTSGSACPGAFYQEREKETSYRAVLESMSKQDQQDLLTAKQATAKYHDIEAAKADGYVQEGPYAGIPGGGMGIHYTKFVISDDAILNPAEPETLLYEPQADGSLKLIGIEYHVGAELVDVENGEAIPSIFGQQLDGTMLDHHEDAAKMTCEEIADPSRRHYDLHVWVWKHNPNGMFAMWNSKVTDKSIEN